MGCGNRRSEDLKIWASWPRILNRNRRSERGGGTKMHLLWRASIHKRLACCRAAPAICRSLRREGLHTRPAQGNTCPQLSCSTHSPEGQAGRGGRRGPAGGARRAGSPPGRGAVPRWSNFWVRPPEKEGKGTKFLGRLAAGSPLSTMRSRR